MPEILQALAQGFLIGSTYGMLALGMGLVYSVSGIVNFSHGDFVLLGMYLCFALASAFALDPYLSVLITVPLMMGLGGLLYHYLVRPIAGHHLLMVIQLTLGVSLLVQNALLMSFGGQFHRAPSFIEAKLLLLGPVVVRLPQVIAAAAAFTIAFALYGVLRFTDVGRAIRAVHQNARAAALMGIDVDRVRLVAFAAGIGLLAVAAALIAPGTPMHPSMGLRYTAITLIVVVLGGMTNFVGIMLAGLIIGISEAMGTIYLSDTLGMLLPYAIFVAIMLFRPQGLLRSA